MSQGSQATSRSGKKQGTDSLLKPEEEIQFGLLTFRTLEQICIVFLRH
jgi:hypothetical protein